MSRVRRPGGAPGPVPGCKCVLYSLHFAPDALKAAVCHCRERERELYGPKKRGPKPKTFLLKVDAAAPRSCAQISSRWKDVNWLYFHVYYN